MHQQFSSSKWIPLFDAPRFFPKDRRGRYPHVSCIYRWAKTGRKGVVLETWIAGKFRATTPEAIARFVERLTVAADRKEPPLVGGHTEAAAALERLNNSVFRRARKAKG